MFAGSVPVCRELSAPSGAIDLIYLNESGAITIAECKLWRNPEARRKVIGQVLDYAKDIAGWEYEIFERACLDRMPESRSLFAYMQERYPDLDESTFIDQVQRNLRLGRFLLLIIGDGIRENVEGLTDYIQANSTLNFTLSMVELPVYRHSSDDLMVITPRVIMKTMEIERVVVRLDDGRLREIPKPPGTRKQTSTISEQVFFEKLTGNKGAEIADRFKRFLEELEERFGTIRKIGRGSASLNIKTQDDAVNLACVRVTGEVEFYAVVSKTNDFGNRQIGIDYLRELATLLNADFVDSLNEWYWCVKRHGRYVMIEEYMDIKDEWMELIGEVVGGLRKLEG